MFRSGIRGASRERALSRTTACGQPMPAPRSAAEAVVLAYAVPAPGWPTADAAAARFRERWPHPLPLPASRHVIFDARAAVEAALEPAARRRLQEVAVRLAPSSRPRVLVVNRLEALGRTLRTIDESLCVLLCTFDHVAVSDVDGLGETVWLDRAVLGVIAACAAVEHRDRAARTLEGQRHARGTGKRIGRPPALNEADRRGVQRALEGGASVRATARRYGVAEATIRNVREHAPA